MTPRRVVATAAALAALAFSPVARADVSVPEVGPGDRGAGVRLYQGELNDWLESARPGMRPLAEDGIYGPRTAAVTRMLERSAGIEVDGRADEATWRALYRRLGDRAADRLDTAAAVAEWPLPVPQWFWAWARWYLHRAEFADEPLRSAATRPADAPVPIPAWAWRRLEALNGRPPLVRADHFAEDVVQQRLAPDGGRLPEADVTVTPQRRSGLAPGWALLTAGFTRDGERGQAAVWLRLVQGRWVPWEVAVLGDDSLEPPFVPCDLKPAFAEAFCAQVPGTEPGDTLLAFATGARLGQAGRMYGLLTPAARERLGPLATFRTSTARTLRETLGAFPADAGLVLAERLGGGHAVVAIAGERRGGSYGAYAAALRRVDGLWRVDLRSPVTVTPLQPEGGARLDRVTRLAARAEAPRALDAVRLWLDGDPFPAEGGGPSARQETVFGQPRAPLAAGPHVVVAYARAGEDAAARAWTFTVR